MRIYAILPSMMHNDNIPTSSDKSNNFSGYLAGHLIAKQKKVVFQSA